uniref:Uncharacterized protein n=1 Tax=Brassica oleracea var. oleracea TaxID=109376 RepID=A0A0D3AVQ3_BRAOL
MVEIQKKEFVTNGAIPLQVNRSTIAAVINGQSLDELTGKQYLFQIRVTPYNFTPNHLTFTVSVITEDVAVKTHSRVKASTSPTNGMPE